MVNTREYNNKRFSIYESEEKTALALMNELGQACNEVLDRTDKVEKENNKKVSYEELHTKYQLTTDGTTANFNGSWQGLKKPTLSEEGAFAQVEKNMADIIEINEQLDKKVNESEVNKRLRFRNFKPKFGYNCYWGEIWGTDGTHTQKTRNEISNDLNHCNELGLD